MATRYLEVEAFKDWARDEVSVDDDLIDQAINAAELAIDNALQRRMVVVTDGAPGLSARAYVPAASDLLFIDDCTEVTVITDNGTTLTVGTDYQLEPLNGLSGAGESVPYYKVRRLSGCWYRDGHKATVSVTARWGWAAIPPQVLESCKIVTQDILENRNTRFGLAGISQEGFSIRIRENPVVAKMILNYQYATRAIGMA